MEQRVKEYFDSGRKKLVSVSANNDYTLLLEYDNGEKRVQSKYLRADHKPKG